MELFLRQPCLGKRLAQITDDSRTLIPKTFRPERDPNGVWAPTPPSFTREEMARGGGGSPSPKLTLQQRWKN